MSLNCIHVHYFGYLKIDAYQILDDVRHYTQSFKSKFQSSFHGQYLLWFWYEMCDIGFTILEMSDMGSVIKHNHFNQSFKFMVNTCFDFAMKCVILDSQYWKWTTFYVSKLVYSKWCGLIAIKTCLLNYIFVFCIVILIFEQ